MITNKTFDEIHIGDSASMQRVLTKQDIDVFGLLSGDMNPTHFSDEYAQMLLERHKLVGHSMWGGSLISSLLGNDLPYLTLHTKRALDAYLHGRITFPYTETLSGLSGKNGMPALVHFPPIVEPVEPAPTVTVVAVCRKRRSRVSSWRQLTSMAARVISWNVIRRTGILGLSTASCARMRPETARGAATTITS
mgnify:CR=1 FL=1